MKRIWLLVAVGCGDPVASRDAAIAGDAPPGDASIACVAIDAAPSTVPSGPACTANGLPGQCLDVAACTGSRTPVAGQCAGSAAIECCTPRFADGITCDPDVHVQPNQCLVEDAGDPGCPAGMAHVGAFCIDRFEAALVDATTGTPWSPYFPPPATARAVSLRGAVPQGFISQVAAQAACGASGKRLCTDAEWLRACEGPSGTTYPYGDARQPGVCNDARAVHPAVELYGTTDAWIFAHLDSPCLSQEADGLDRTGANAGCVTAEGVFDMMGNLHEWTADPQGTFRGGFYVDTRQNGEGCRYATTAHAATYDDYSTGFRCCADVH
ncbi:MAG: SUMF1/EgtB/PvdO family nonheme iron enzyme [Proteobacteria bacterium]|nr:SUMF1/EgtB/PvdO family nonheme iron enzyme [Pseudomonadota bacterium]